MPQTYISQWDSVILQPPAAWKRVLYNAVYKTISTIRSESASTPNHAARLTWANLYQPQDASPSVIPSKVDASPLLAKYRANADVAYYLDEGVTDDSSDSLIGPANTVIATECPTAS